MRCEGSRLVIRWSTLGKNALPLGEKHLPKAPRLLLLLPVQQLIALPDHRGAETEVDRGKQLWVTSRRAALLFGQ
ncbi:hypothetical protein RRG08_020485 [Elysia crispata]|uniref:Uncharacterized protein n=1 Tax=Elysia crispata TaxID=231223 RepID=A0AAE1DFU2_9GAST|nr:hypothetical protein RRG08_020485 [Elysia crispata]